MDELEVSTPPAIDGDFWVFGDGRRIARQRGAEGEGDAAVADTTDGDAGVEDQGDSTENQTGDQSYDAPFSLDEVPEEYRGDVERYVKQTQADYTRKTQSLAEQRREVERFIDLNSKLADPEARNAALKDFLNEYDIDLELEGAEDDDDDGGYEPDADDDFEDMPPWARELVERERSRQEAERQSALEGQSQALRDHVTAALNTYTEAAYPDLPEGESLPDDEHNMLLGLGMVLPPQSDGMPDMEAAATLLSGFTARIEQRLIDSKKGRGLPATRTGSDGTEKPNLGNEKERLSFANQVAARHLQEA